MKHTSHTPVHGQITLMIARGLLFVLLLFFALGPSQADDRPVIEVNFRIMGGIFDGLTAESRAAIEAEVEEKISNLAEKRRGFLDWSYGVKTSEQAAKWNVTLKVERKPVTNDSGGTSTGFIGTLEHSGQLATRHFAFDQTEENETIYPLARPIPSQDATALGDDILKQLDKQLGILFESPEVEGYIKSIPIVAEVIADAAKTRIVIPIKMSDLHSEGIPVLAVFFIDPNDNRGRLELEAAAEVREEGQHKGYVIGRVKDLVLFPINISTPTWWDDQLFPVLNSAREVKVYMFEYNPSLAGSWATENGVSTDPDQGGETP